MPPRRSSRAPSASVEPTPIETLPAKRKRGQPADPEVEEKENAAKPPSRTRRGSSVRSSVPPPSKARKSSRSQTSLPDVAESDNEEQSEAPPPVKKARPSNEHEIKEEPSEEEQMEVKPKRGKRAASVAKSTRAADMGVDEETPSKPASRRTSSRKAAVSSGSRTTTSVGSAKSGEASGSARVEEPEVDISEEEDVKPAKGRRSTKRAPSKSLQSDDEDGGAMSDYNEDGDVKPARRGRKAKAPVARKGKAPGKTSTIEEDSDEDLEPPPPVQPRIIEPTPEVEEEEEEEKSLFDPPPAPSQSTLPPPPPEEPAGPKARLVIHKMALDVKRLVHFHKSFSAISNTIDALLFVFGFRASKMRQGKISELIHNSANYPDLQDFVSGSQLVGEVESIAQMKPKAPSEHEDGLLEYLEDIIGTSKYKEPIDEAMVEMERLQEDRQMKLNRLRHVESEKQALEAKKKEAEDFLRLKNEHVRAQSRLFQWTLMRCLELEEKLATQLEKLQKELEKETEQNRGDIDHLEQLKEHYEEREKAYAEVQAAAATAVKDLATLERREVGLQEKRKHASGRAKKDTTARKTALNVIEDSTSKIKKEKQKLEEHELSLEEEEKVLEEIRDSLKDKTQQKELQPWTTKINKKQADVDVAQQNNFKAEKLQIQKDVQAGDQRLKLGAQSRVNELKGKAANARSKVDEVKANQSENRSRNNVLDSLTSLKNSGQIEGLHGRLGSLGTIPDKYDVAISTACGANLNFMVVDRVAQAQSCIEYMRKNNVGRASFMILEKIGQGNADKTPTPDGVPRLFDLVKPKDPIYAPAFFKAIGNTLVANDIDQANRIAFAGGNSGKRWRVVTLDGALIETSGAMSGGGSQLSRGAMSSKLAAATVTPEVLRSYERESDQAAQQYQKALADLRDAEQELERLKSREPEIDLAYQKVGMDIENLKRRIAEAEKRAKDLNAQNKPNGGDLARIKSLEQEIGAAATELDELKEKSAKVEQDIKDLEKKILEIGGSKLLSQRSKVDGLRLHMKLANDEITKAEVAKTKADKDSKKLETNIANNSKAFEEADAEMEELDAEMKKVANHIAELKEEVESAQAAAENSKEDLDNLKAQLDEQEARIAKFRQKELKLRNSISDTKKDIDENNRATEHYTELHDELTLEEIDEDDEDEEEQAASPEAPQTSEHPDGEAQVKVEAGAEGEPRQKAMPEKRKSTAAPSNELQIYSTEELRKYNRPELIANTEYLDEKIKKARPDLSVLKEYKQREQEFFNRAQDLDKVTAERDAQKAKYEGLRKQRLDEFMAGFNLISLKLKEMYQMITLGGNAELELVDSMDPFSEGIIFSVMPPKKSWKNISNLSGGEKTLSSLALVFALHVFKPTPLYFMDEIDAALDFRNVSIVANYIKDRTKNAQFIIISLRNDMFELSHRLIGIYKTSNATRSISIDNHALQTTIPPPRPSANVVA
ncbi:hypothetical protein CPB84DRAFT_1764970 [Gymnopilus junonius]|uniref:Structural maintenance of chromosomes protein 4 n=1 Tax=Gymnopilus junonius TaxID=109634 RepID=A0A9P5P025_GYMJU|nr:hypothetical protein CPB84DRAFT_1764970 [Gymnopilus junonius]